MAELKGAPKHEGDADDIAREHGMDALGDMLDEAIIAPPKKDAKIGRHESADAFVPKGESIQVPPLGAGDLQLAGDVLFWVIDNDHDTWVNVGKALKDALGEHGRALWDRWSRGREGKYDAKEQDAKWRSFEESGAGFDALLQIAKEYGYQPYRKPSSERKKAEQKEAAGDQPEEKANAHAKSQEGKQLNKFKPIPGEASSRTWKKTTS